MRAASRMLALVVLSSLVSLSSGCWSMRYLAKAGAGQFRLLHSRRKIVDVLADPDVPAATKKNLQIAVAARDFGREVLGLRGGDAYTRYIDLGDKPVAWNVTAAKKDALALVTWRFPIVGSVPYLGYFERRDADAEAARLAAEGYDIYERPVIGFSTLGYFAEPIFSSMIEGPPHHIVEVVLHEMLHSTVYVPGDSAFNESFAELVGVEGSALFFRMRGEEESAARVLADAERDEEHERLFGIILAALVEELKTLFASNLTSEQKIEGREIAYIRAQAEYLRLLPSAPGEPPPSFTRKKLNNAMVLSYGLYHSATPHLRELLTKLHGDLPFMVALAKQAIDRGVDVDTYLERAAKPRKHDD